MEKKTSLKSDILSMKNTDIFQMNLQHTCANRAGYGLSCCFGRVLLRHV